jgi:phosphate transport system substrate-binding protein
MQSMSACIRILGVGLSAALLLPALASADVLRVGGRDAALGMVEKVGEAFSNRTDDRLEFISSLGSTGGLRAVADRVIDLAVSGRPLKPEEVAQGLWSALTVRTPFVLATSHPKPAGLSSADIVEAFRSEKALWPDGSPLRIILRPRTQSDTALMIEFFPGLAAALEKARRRPDVPVTVTDRDNATTAEQISGSLVGMALTQVVAEHRDLRFVPIDGAEPSLEAFEKGAYRFGKTLHLVLPPNPSPAAERFVAFLRSPEAQQALRDTGSLVN